MSEATRLTQEGRLSEATDLIQNLLGGSTTASSPGSSGDGVEAPSRTRKALFGDTGSSRTERSGRSLRQAPGVSRSFRSASRSLKGGARERTTAQTEGRLIERSYTNRFGTRDYELYVPSGYTGQTVTMIVMLHGCTQSPSDLAVGTRMNELAEAHTFLVAYPSQTSSANSSRCWNWFESANQRRGQGEPSIIAGITCEVLGEYNVDPDRVYIAGMSAGGAMAAIVGTSYPDLYAAIGVHSGLAPGSAHDLRSGFAAMRKGGSVSAAPYVPSGTYSNDSSRVLPAIVFHGDRDKTVHPRNADRVVAHLTASAGDSNISSKPVLRVTKQQGQASDGHAYTLSTYQDAEGHALVEHWTVHGLGHAWSGGSRPGSYVDPSGPDASAEMVRFFHQQRR